MTSIRERDSFGIIAWTSNPGRLNDIGYAFKVEPKIVAFDKLRSRRTGPLRYLLSVAPTVVWLIRRRPRGIMVTCPPPFAAAIVALYAWLTGAGFILDAHPSAFGLRGRVWRLLVPLQRTLVKRATATMVTEAGLGDVVSRWGGTPLVFHEAPPAVVVSSQAEQRASEGPLVVFTTIFAPDEPLESITAAAQRLSEFTVAITGDESRLTSALRKELAEAPNVQLTGWLDQMAYLTLISSADVVVALTTDVHSVMRSAFEAAYFERPTVLSDTGPLRAAFCPSEYVDNSTDAIVRSVRNVMAAHDSWIEQAAARRTALVERWERQREALEEIVARAQGTATVRSESGAMTYSKASGA